ADVKFDTGDEEESERARAEAFSFFPLGPTARSAQPQSPGKFRREEEHCQSPTAVNVSDQTIRNRPHEDGLRARRPVVGPVLAGQHRRAQLAFATEHQNWQIRHRRLVLFTDENRFYLSTCDRCERPWRRRGECYAACNIIQHDWFGGGLVMVWGGISLEGRTDLYRPDNGTLTAIRYQDEILGPLVRPYTGVVGPGFLLVHNNAWPHVARVCRHFYRACLAKPSGIPKCQEKEQILIIQWRNVGSVGRGGERWPQPENFRASDFGLEKKSPQSEPMYTMPPIATKHLESAYGAKHLDESSAGHLH
ncbi:hypothetical protein NFI96_015663, partial [Prochilodus magdalenae]